MNIVVVDYEMGNLFSVKKGFKRIGIEVVISSNKKIIQNADKLLLPGVGHFKKGMENLKNKGLDESIKTFANEGKPILGICLGMQLLTNFSEEGNVEGLKLIDAETKRFLKTDNIKIPHVGWNTVSIKNPSPLFDKTNLNETFYFVHSYRVQTKNPENIICQTKYGILLDSGVMSKNIFGVQFHPEKSHQPGLHILENFAKL